MRNGFLYNKIVLPYKKDKYFKIPFYFKRDGNVSIFYNDEFKAKQKRFTKSNSKQYFEFKINEDLDLDNKYFLEYSGNAEFKMFYPFPFETMDAFLTRIKDAKNSFILFEEATIFFSTRSCTLETSALTKSSPVIFSKSSI